MYKFLQTSHSLFILRLFGIICSINSKVKIRVRVTSGRVKPLGLGSLELGLLGLGLRRVGLLVIVER